MSIISPWYHLAYIIPHAYTDMDAYQFYRVAPEGMMLVTTGLNLQGHSLAAVEQELPALWDRVDLLAKRKVDRSIGMFILLDNDGAADLAGLVAT